MRIDEIVLRRVRLPLVAPFRTAAGTLTDREVVVVEVRSDRGPGWGECAALPAPTYTEEWLDGAWLVLRDHLVPRLLARGDLTSAALPDVFGAVVGHSMAKCALEMAVLDAELRTAGRSLADHLGGVRHDVEVGVAVGITSDVGSLLRQVEGYVAQGYRRVKVKIEPGWDVEPLRALRHHFGDTLALQADANGAYTLGDARHLAHLDDLDLLLVEQPLAADDLLGHAELARHLRTPVCLDESITSARAAATAIRLGACSVVCLKAPRVGGYGEARRVHDVCEANGVACWVGGMLDTGIGRAAGLALASLPGCTLPADLSGSDRYFSRDLTAPLLARDGRMVVPRGPGLGVDIDHDALDGCTIATERVPAG